MNNFTASSPEDFAATSGVLTFAPGEVSKSITVDVVGDTLEESAEQFVVNLSNATNATMGFPEGVGTIIDNESPETTIVTGEIVLDANGSGSRDPNERLVQGVVVILTGTSESGEPVFRSTTTDQFGKFVFLNVPVGTYTVTEVQPDNLINGGANSFPVFVTSGVLQSFSFIEAGIHPAFMSKRDLLSSTPDGNVVTNASTSSAVRSVYVDAAIAALSAS